MDPNGDQINETTIQAKPLCPRAAAISATKANTFQTSTNINPMLNSPTNPSIIRAPLLTGTLPAKDPYDQRSVRGLSAR